ncbi:S-layer homology domain-containing protein [Paenibacillus alba]|uniref:S-layer homology domain-containing protein n=1 Tax=Paenibacillus alba TaxID=1197127 RepID=UPI0015644DFB|nr:S-layer homology domain-containing protein [Paenibacillus alba]NQX67246.1 S-layer homology domain-containing protein [Paenibacillus alba]
MRTKKDQSIYLIVTILIITCIMHFAPQSAEANAVWSRPQIVPIPNSVSGVANPVISLGGTWKFTLSTPADFWKNTTDPSSWSDIQVPGEAFMQNFNISQNYEYPYKKQISIPSDYNGKRVILRFEGVYSYARVWVNGNYVRDHTGGFTAWDCDITDYVTPGQPAWITVGVTDKSDDISSEDEYAKHNIGGILRDVKLVALPQNYVTRFHASTDFDATYTNATLNVTGAASLNGASNATLNFSLKDPQGNDVAMSPDSMSLSTSTAERTVSIPVASPQKWDAEHPNLYTLTANLEVGGSIVQTITKKIGFRKVVKNGNQVFVNGKEIKLRGVNAHDIDPLMGRATNDALDDATVAKFADGNINFIRTSHYPKSDAFLDAADKYGVYVEEESAVVWQGEDYEKTTIHDANFTASYMNQFSEMLEKDLTHPSIIIWSLGNETKWGINFQKELDYVKAEDPTRLTVVSWGNTQTDINSSHYPNYNGNLAPSGTQPTLHDEYVHVNSYNTDTQKRDPNARNFWGESIKKFWENMFPTTGALGGAIWASPDEVFQSPLNNWIGGYGEWGIIDGWRRDKPEFWLTKKAYSPIRIPDVPVANPGSGKTMQIPIENWFDHTNFNEVSFNWRAGSDSGSITNLNVAPHKKGTLVIPGRNWQYGDTLNIQVYKSSKLIDEYNLTVGTPVHTFEAVQGTAPIVSENASNITVSGSNFSIVFSKASGQVTNGTYNGSTILVGGPRINLAPVNLSAFSLSSISQTVQGSQAVIRISGSYGTMGVNFTVSVDGAGLVTTGYRLTNPIDGAKETGVIYDVSGSVDRLSWDRKGLWSAYPADHIGRNTGIANKISENNDAYRVKPTWSWSQDMKDFFLYGSNDIGGRGTNDFRSQKEYIHYASAIMSGSNNRLRAESDGTAAVRMEINTKRVDDRDPSITYSGAWSDFNDAGDFKSTEKYSNTVGAYVQYTFTGTGISLIGPKNNNMGTCDIYIDGTLVQSDIELYEANKNFQQALYTHTGLSNGTHTIKVVVKSGFVVIDAFEPSGGSPTSIAMAINNQWAYDDLEWGNYETSMTVPSGYSNTVKMRLTDNDSSSITYNPVTRTENDNTTGTGTNQFDYVGSWGYYGSQSGAYQNDNHYSNTAGAYALLRFTGSKVQLYGAKNNNQGIAAFSIDNGPETLVDTYAPSRSDQQLLFESDELKNQEHVLRIRVTGQKKANANDSFLSIDRADIQLGVSGKTDVVDPVKVATINITSSGNVSTITAKGGSLQLQAAVLPANATNKSVTWTVYETDGATATDKATINQSGLLTAAKDGIVKVIATATDGSMVQGEMGIILSGQTDVVDPGTDPVDVATINITSTVLTITAKGGSLQLQAAVFPANATNKSVTWAVYEADGATVTDKAIIDVNGLLTAVKDGTVKVVATAVDGSKVHGEMVITLSGQTDVVDPGTDPVKVATINITSAGNVSTITAKGETLQLQAAVLPANTTNKSVTWAVYEADGRTPTDKAIIDVNGLLAAAKDGIVKVVATANDGSLVFGNKVITISGQNDNPGPNPGSGSSNGSSGSSGSGSPTTPPVKEDPNRYVPKDTELRIDPAQESQTAVTAIIDRERLAQKLADLKAASSSILNFELPGEYEKNAVQLPLDILYNRMKENKGTVLTLRNHLGSYNLPLSILSREDVASAVNMEGAVLIIRMDKAKSQQEKQFEQSIANQGMKRLSDMIEYKVILKSKDKEVEITYFGNSFITRLMKVEGAIQDSSIATVVVYDPATGELKFVPSVFTVNNGKTEVTITRNTNSLYAIVQNKKTFDDMNGHWAQKEVENLASKMVIDGTTDRTYTPEMQVTRAQFAALLVRGLGLPTETTPSVFTDVAATQWYASEVGTAAKYGLVQGVGEGRFNPDELITREQMVVMMMKAVHLVQGESKPEAVANTRLADQDQLSDYTRSAVAEATSKGLVHGKTETTFAPQDAATRAEAAVLIKQAMQYLKLIN